MELAADLVICGAVGLAARGLRSAFRAQPTIQVTQEGHTAFPPVAMEQQILQQEAHGEELVPAELAELMDVPEANDGDLGRGETSADQDDELFDSAQQARASLAEEEPDLCDDLNVLSFLEGQVPDQDPDVEGLAVVESESPSKRKRSAPEAAEAEDIASPESKRRRTTLGSFFTRVAAACGTALFGASTAEGGDQEESSASEELDSGTEDSEASDAEMTAAEQNASEPEAVGAHVQEGLAGASTSAPEPTVFIPLNPPANLGDTVPAATAAQAEHASHSEAVALVRAAFDGRMPTPADMVEWQTSRDSLAEALGEQPLKQQPTSQPAIRRAVQQPEPRQPRQQPPRSTGQLNLPPISVDWSNPIHVEEPGLPWQTVAEDEDGPADHLAPAAAAADQPAADLTEGGNVEPSMFDFFNRTFTQPGLFWQPRPSRENAEHPAEEAGRRAPSPTDY
ncbi:hypothetical protein WJX73_000503 [Symbiochloris irregularis]|uniref:Uncharacterized protein n=1 Tax=Symbiochloris irregularis TaxID=706552 RepID=A0AAW1P5H8_9CHLO